MMLCHWAGMYCNGNKQGFADFKKVVLALRGRFAKQTLWMKLSEIARYEAAKQLTQFELQDDFYVLEAPFACPDFTIRLADAAGKRPVLATADQQQRLLEVKDRSALRAGTFVGDGEDLVVCMDLRKGTSRLAC